MRSRTLFIALLAFATSGLSLPAAHADKPIPPPPYYYVLDEPHALDPRALRTIETLLIEHDRLTGEQVLVAIFNSLDGEDVVDYTNRVFAKWRVGQRGKDNGVLLALYWKDHKSRIEVGYGLEPVLTDAKSNQILSSVLAPALKDGRASEGIAFAALDILKTLGSPLIQSGKAQEILRSGGAISAWRGSRAMPMSHGGVVWLFLLFILVFIVFQVFASAETHFTSAGSYRSTQWRSIQQPIGGASPTGNFAAAMLGSILGSMLGSSGWGGGGGGFGGFMGGGGSSGGGGASGGW